MCLGPAQAGGEEDHFRRATDAVEGVHPPDLAPLPCPIPALLLEFALGRDQRLFAIGATSRHLQPGAGRVSIQLDEHHLVGVGDRHDEDRGMTDRDDSVDPFRSVGHLDHVLTHFDPSIRISGAGGGGRPHGRDARPGGVWKDR
jgi:hypothetical protein